MKPNYLIKYLLVGLSMVWYVILYHFIDRSEFLFFISGIAVLGFSYFYWLSKPSFSPKEILVIAVLFRAIFLVGTPNLSDDYYRFYWDGMMSNKGTNPYELTPNQFNRERGKELNIELKRAYFLMNSQNYYSVYPPISQFFFKASTFLSKGSLSGTIFFLKLFLFLFDIGLIIILIQFLRKLMMPVSLAQIYALNPLVIIELTGNLHFEGVMLTFLFAGIFYLWKNRILLASLSLGLSIGIKIIPLLILPLFLPFIGIKKSLKLYLGVFITVCLFSAPYVSIPVFQHFSESINLYFQTFEFNASIYYLAKEVSIRLLGYKSTLVGIILPLTTLVGIVTLSAYLWKSKPLLKQSRLDVPLFMKYSAISIASYYLLSSTVHPWYVINVLIFSVFAYSRAFVAWSLLVFLSYFAYSQYVIDYSPNNDFNTYWPYYFLLIIQYLFVLFIFIFDLSHKKRNR